MSNSPHFNKADGLSLIFNDFMPKSRHDGKNVISPTVPAPSANAGKDDIDAYKAGKGETDPNGFGCWVVDSENN